MQMKFMARSARCSECVQKVESSRPYPTRPGISATQGPWARFGSFRIRVRARLGYFRLGLALLALHATLAALPSSPEPSRDLFILVFWAILGRWFYYNILIF